MSLWLALAPQHASAQTEQQDDAAAAVSEDDAVLARQFLDEGVEAFQARDYVKAQDLFRRSFNIKRSYDTAINLGNVELKLELYRDAAEHLDYGFRFYPDG